MTIKGGSAVAPLIGTIGDVGIGTESPTEKLEVNGTIKATELITTRGSLAQRGFFLYLTFFCIGAILHKTREKNKLRGKNLGGILWRLWLVIRGRCILDRHISRS